MPNVVNPTIGGTRPAVVLVVYFYFLAGVFISGSPRNATTPPALDFRTSALGTDFAMLSPDVQQLFWIGTAVRKSGDKQEFIVPSGAESLCLGFVDGVHSDNQGFVRVTVSMTPVRAMDGGPDIGATLPCPISKPQQVLIGNAAHATRWISTDSPNCSVLDTNGRLELHVGHHEECKRLTVTPDGVALCDDFDVQVCVWCP